jgi:hypothetical protein
VMGLQARNVAFAVLLLMLVVAPAVLASTIDEAQVRGEIRIEFEEGAVLEIGGLDKNGIVLSVRVPETAGAEFEKDYGSHEVYLQYTTLVPEGQTFTITAHLQQPKHLPEGLALVVTAEIENENDIYAGNPGTPGQAVLSVHSGNPQPIVTGIGTCVTGTGGEAGGPLPKGVKLSYSLLETDVGAIRADKYKVKIVFTIGS